MKIAKAAHIAASGTPTPEQLAQINAQAKTPLTAEEVYVFSVRLCDDQPDRDYERFDTAALPRLAELFVGKTGISDHAWSSDRQIARIFATEVCSEGGVHYVRAWAYMLRQEQKAIAEIEGGIKREVSIGCAMGAVRCSICQAPYGSCGHEKGEVYDGQICLAVLCEPVDAYEFSFVAVPAQREAGVMKQWRGGETMTLPEYVKKSDNILLCDAFEQLSQEAALGRAYLGQMRKDVVRLGLVLELGLGEPELTAVAARLAPDELKRVCAALERKAAELFPPQPQLQMQQRREHDQDEFLI